MPQNVKSMPKTPSFIGWIGAVWADPCGACGQRRGETRHRRRCGDSGRNVTDEIPAGVSRRTTP